MSNTAIPNTEFSPYFPQHQEILDAIPVQYNSTPVYGSGGDISLSYEDILEKLQLAYTTLKSDIYRHHEEVLKIQSITIQKANFLFSVTDIENICLGKIDPLSIHGASYTLHTNLPLKPYIKITQQEEKKQQQQQVEKTLNLVAVNLGSYLCRFTPFMSNRSALWDIVFPNMMMLFYKTDFNIESTASLTPLCKWMQIKCEQYMVYFTQFFSIFVNDHKVAITTQPAEMSKLELLAYRMYKIIQIHLEARDRKRNRKQLPVANCSGVELAVYPVPNSVEYPFNECISIQSPSPSSDFTQKLSTNTTTPQKINAQEEGYDDFQSVEQRKWDELQSHFPEDHLRIFVAQGQKDYKLMLGCVLPCVQYTKLDVFDLTITNGPFCVYARESKRASDILNNFWRSPSWPISRRNFPSMWIIH